MAKKVRARDRVDAAELADRLIGLTIDEAQRVAARHGLKVRDGTPSGWYTGEHDRHRLTVTTDSSGHIRTSVPG